MQKLKIEELMIKTHNAQSLSFSQAATALRLLKGRGMSKKKNNAIKAKLIVQTDHK